MHLYFMAVGMKTTSTNLQTYLRLVILKVQSWTSSTSNVGNLLEVETGLTRAHKGSQRLKQQPRDLYGSALGPLHICDGS